MPRGAYTRSVFVIGLALLALCSLGECAQVATTIQTTDTRALKAGFEKLSLDSILQLEGLTDEHKADLRESLGHVDELLQMPGMGHHLHQAFLENMHGEFGKAMKHHSALEGLDLDRLVSLDTELGEEDKAAISRGVGEILDGSSATAGILNGHPKIIAHERPHHTPQQELEFVCRANGDHWKITPSATKRNTFLVKIKNEKGTKKGWFSSELVTSSFWVRYNQNGGWEWSPKGEDECFAFVKTKSPPCWFTDREDVKPQYLALVDHLHAHQKVPLGITASQRPSIGENVMALGYGFVNGLFMGMGDLFRDAFRNPDCDGVGEAYSNAQSLFGQAFGATMHCVKDTLTFKRGESKACDVQSARWKAFLHGMKVLFSKCRTLQKTVGVILAVVLVAVLAIQAISMIIGSAAGPIGTLIGAAVGVIVKIGAIVMAAVFGLHFMAKTVKKYLGARRRCAAGPCIKRDIILMREAATEMFGVWVGIFAMSGLNKVIEMPKFRALFSGQRPRFKPEFLQELKSLKVAYHNAKHGKKVPLNVVDDAVTKADDVVSKTDDAVTKADDATKQADDAADELARQKQVEADELARRKAKEAEAAAKKEADDALRAQEEAARKAREADELAKKEAEAARRAQEEAARKAREADELAKREAEAAKRLQEEAARKAKEEAARQADEAALKALDEAVQTPKKALGTEITEAEAALRQARLNLKNHRSDAANWKPGPSREYTRATHVGNGRFESRSYGKVAQYNPHNKHTGRYEKAVKKAEELVAKLKASAIQSSQSIDEAASATLNKNLDRIREISRGYGGKTKYADELAELTKANAEIVKKRPEYALRRLADAAESKMEAFRSAKASYERSGSGYYSDRAWAKGKEAKKIADKITKSYHELLAKCDARCKSALADIFKSTDEPVIRDSVESLRKMFELSK